MKKFLMTMLLLATVGVAIAQTPEEKAAAKAAEKAHKEAVKAAQSKMNDGIKIRDAVNLLYNANQTELQKGPKADQEVIQKNQGEIKAKSKEASALLRDALATGLIPEKKLFDGWKALEDVSSQLLNPELQKASQNTPFDTLTFANAVTDVQNAFHGELTTGNPKDDIQKAAMARAGLALPNTMVYDAYLCMFYIQDKNIEGAKKALENYETFATRFPETATDEKVLNPQYPAAQLAFNIYYTAYTQKDYETMNAYYDKALQFDDAESHSFVEQSRAQVYQALGDTENWEKSMKEMIENNPTSESAETAIWNLAANYAKESDNDKLKNFVQWSLEKSPESKSANIWMGRILKTNQDPEGAIKYLEKAAELDPSEGMVHELIGEAYYDIAIKNNRAIDKKISARKYKNQAEADKDIDTNVKSYMRKAVTFFEKAKENAGDNEDITKFSQQYIDEITKLLK